MEDNQSNLEYLFRTIRRLRDHREELEAKQKELQTQIENQEVRIQRLQDHLRDARRLTEVLEEDSIRRMENRQKKSYHLNVQINRALASVTSRRDQTQTIAGGFAGGGASANDRKRYARTIMNLNYDDLFAIPGYSTITFGAEDFKGVQPHDGDPLVVAVTIRNMEIRRVLIDGGSSVNVMYGRCFELLQIPIEAVKNYPGTLSGFTGHPAKVHGYLDVSTTFGGPERQKTTALRYMILDAPSACDLILGRPALNDLAAAVSYPQLCMKLPLLDGQTLTVRGDQAIARKCYAESARVQTVRDTTMQPRRTIATLSGYFRQCLQRSINPRARKATMPCLLC